MKTDKIVYGLNNQNWLPQYALDGALCCGNPEFHYPGGEAAKGFDVEDIEVITHHYGSEEYGDADYAGVGQLKDGQWFAWEGSHDYTGWDCRAGSVFVLCSTQEDAFRFGLSKESRRLFRIELPDDTD